MTHSKLILQLESLEQKYRVLEPDQQQRHELSKHVKKFSDGFLNQIDDVPTFINDHQLAESIAIDSEAESLATIIDTYQSQVVEKGINPASGGHIGYIPGGGIYASALADYMAAVSNEYSGVFYASPGGVAIENEVISWLKKSFEFPDSAVGNLTSGGSIANLIALTVARDKHKVKNEHVTRAVVYMSSQVHHCMNKALRIIGLEDVHHRSIRLDSNSRMDAKDLDRQIKFDKEQGLQPFLIVASAGTTDTGAIDPLDAIAKIADEHKLWFHVDAAYGGFFMLLESMKSAFAGIEKADSLVVDPHKGMFLPYGLGAVLVKDRQAVFHSHHYSANYMQDADGENSMLSPADLSPELTKHFRGLRMWLPLKLYGVEPFKACLQHKLLLTHYFRDELRSLGFDLGPEPDLSVSYFWYPCKQIEPNIFNRQLLKNIHADGRVFLSSTLIEGQYVIRMAILSFRTTVSTIRKAMKMIRQALSDTKLQLVDK
ncbi:MAG: aminotransferase class I/II-fold pyridoxal phosphate-dependent enzyme [Proteobacteria bacterium]|nr:aminotransferase class I/II-fold pyridoxal phosphate-dependent enzyme [Pseudomonadota bacterium]